MTSVPVARVALAHWPTPLEPAPRLAAAIDLDPDRLWIKRDDLTGLGAGGNKVRKLEWTIAAALADGADTLVTTGAPQSNHARLTAAAAARVGLAVVLVFPGQRPALTTGNLVLDGLLGARIEWAGEPSAGESPERELAAAAQRIADQLRNDGRQPAVIPFGGSNATGAHGYRVAAAEITAQLADVQHVVCAVGSGGTMSGLIAGLGAERVLGIDTGAMQQPHEQVVRLLKEMGCSTAAHELRLRTDQVGDGYSSLTAATAQAIKLAARSEGLILDPIYSGRAMAGLIAAVRERDVRREQTVVFLATGGLPGLFGSAATIELSALELSTISATPDQHND